MDSTRNKLEALIEKQQERIGRGHSQAGLTLGAAMILTGCSLMVFGVPFAFSLTCLVWGSLITALSIWLRSREKTSEVEHSRVLADLHQTSIRLEQRYAIIQKLWQEGLPPECSVADVFLLLEARTES